MSPMPVLRLLMYEVFEWLNKSEVGTKHPDLTISNRTLTRWADLNFCSSLDSKAPFFRGWDYEIETLSIDCPTAF